MNFLKFKINTKKNTKNKKIISKKTNNFKITSNKFSKKKKCL